MERLERGHVERTRQPNMLDKARLTKYCLVTKVHTTISSLMYECKALQVSSLS